MKLTDILIIILPLSQICMAAKDMIPVFLIDQEGVMAHLKTDTNPFYKMSSTYFADVIHDSIKRSDVVIIFVEEAFCVEDISMKDKLGTPFLYLHQGLIEQKVKYFPAVIEPFKLLNQMFPPQKFNVFHLSSGTKLQMFDGHFQYFYIFFEDAKNETRVEALRRHDLIIREVYFVIRQLSPGAVVAFYTGKKNPMADTKINYVPISPLPTLRDPGVMVSTHGALFRFVGVSAVTHTRRMTFNQVPRVSQEARTRRKLTTKMAYTDFDIKFDFSFKNDGWQLDHVALLEGGEEVGRTVMAVGAPWNWAYYCGEPLMLLNTRDGSSVTISEYQIQPFRRHGSRDIEPLTDDDGGAGGDDGGAGGDEGGGGGEGGGEGGGGDDEDAGGKCFGKTINCGPYFNTRILSALFVVTICLGLLFPSLAMLFNCTGCDRYDDPHGKPLSLGTERL